MKDSDKKMTKTQAFNDICMLFNLFDKQNKYDDNEYPFLYNFATFGKWFVAIKKSKRNKFQVCGRVPWHNLWTDNISNKFYDVFDEFETIKEAKDTFYIIVERLSHKEYLS